MVSCWLAGAARTFLPLRLACLAMAAETLAAGSCWAEEAKSTSTFESTRSPGWGPTQQESGYQPEQSASACWPV
uniref:Secreted protein n=1 Tax=Macrostomum lignano TaxID=282301 RepID=A0A1I8FLS4_9PLAT